MTYANNSQLDGITFQFSSSAQALSIYTSDSSKIGIYTFKLYASYDSNPSSFSDTE